MKKFATITKYLPVALALAAFATGSTTPASAKTVHQPAAHSTRQLYNFAPEGALKGSDSAREEALKECNAEAQHWSNMSEQTAQFSAYGACMSRHGVPQL